MVKKKNNPSSIGDDVRNTVTQKEAAAVYYREHVFHRSDPGVNRDGSTRWHCQKMRCKKFKCPVKLKLSATKTVLDIEFEHNHLPPEKAKVVFKEVKCKAKQRIRKEPDSSARKVLTEEINVVFKEGILPMDESTAMHVPVSLKKLKFYLIKIKGSLLV